MELKTVGSKSDRPVGRLINHHSLRHRVVVVSFNRKTVAQIKQVDSSIRTGALFEPRRSVAKIMGRRMIRDALECGADEILLHRLVAHRRMLTWAAQSNLRSVVWTVNDPKWMQRAVALGIHALITNSPALVVATTPKG